MNCPASSPTPPSLTISRLAEILDALPDPETVTEWEYWEVFDKVTGPFQLGESRHDVVIQLAYSCEYAGQVGDDLAQHLAAIRHSLWIEPYDNDEEDWDTDKYSYSDDIGDEEEDDAEEHEVAHLSDTQLEMLGQLVLPLAGIRDLYSPLILPQRPVDLFRW